MPPKCEECQNEVSKYVCPACKQKTCSVECVKKHKERTGCDGERQSQSLVYLPVRDYDDATILEDLNFLGSIADLKNQVISAPFSACSSSSSSSQSQRS